MSGKLICGDGIFVQKSSIYIECNNGTIQFAQMPICFDGTWKAGTTLGFAIIMQKKSRCKM